jgi:hypothetical protein
MQNGRVQKSDSTISKEKETFFSKAYFTLILKAHGSFADCLNDESKCYEFQKAGCKYVVKNNQKCNKP